MFDRLANVVTKRYKLIIVIWAIMLLVSIPAMMMVGDVVKYDSDMSDTSNSESARAAKIVDEYFPSSVANGTLLIVLQSDDMTDAEARDFVIELQERLSNGDIDYLESVNTIYSYSEQVMFGVIMQLGPAMISAEAGVNQSAFMLYGIPEMHVQNWNMYGTDIEAYDATMVQLGSYLSGYDDNTTAAAYAYYNAFAAAWNSSSVLDPVERADASVNAAAPALIDSLPLGASEKAMMLAVLSSFDMSTFNDPSIIHSFTLEMIGNEAGITDTNFLEAVYDLGPDYQYEDVAAHARSIVANSTIDSYPVPIPSSLISGFISPSNGTMLIMMSFSISETYTTSDGSTPLPDQVAEIRSIISDVKDETGYPVTTYVTGMAAISQDMKTSSEDELSLIEPITIVVIVILMGLFFRTVVGQFLPLGAVGVAIGVSQVMIFLLASFVMDVDYMISTMVFAILMAVGTDYSIFIITRYREERIKGAPREQAVHTAVVWAGESVVTSALTVIIAFMAMATADFSFIKSMGVIMTGAIVIALLVALTLIPSILMFFGNRMFWPTTGKRWDSFVKTVMEKKKAGNHGYFHRAATFSVNHAKMILVLAIVLTVPTTYMYVTAETSFDFIGAMGESESIDGMKAMTDDFGAGAIMPTQIVIVGDTVVYDGTSFDIAYMDAVSNITAVIAGESMVSKVTSVTDPYGYGSGFDYHDLDSYSEDERAQYLSAMLSFIGNDNKSLMFTVILDEQPQSADAVAFVPDLRQDMVEAMDSQPAMSGSEILVGGTTAALFDTSESTAKEFSSIEILVIIGIFVVLMLVLGSLLLPVFALISIAMSITWAFSLTYIVFGVWLGLPVLWIIPLILFVMLMGIGMDYNVFILTRIREEIHKGKETKEAVVSAADWTGGIITVLALIMAAAFGALMLSSNAMLQEFGFALMVAVLLDAMVVRTYIVPAALTVMGKKAWWAPGRLQRVGRKEKMAKKDEQQKND
ncbi:MAG: MMPL family transporter [Euryarchaeota archaeon]|nr:MMPL family transporter [Euryarchaeota archaeon]